MDDLISDLAEYLNGKNVLWGIGGSYLLKSYGIVDEVHDLDIIIAEKDIQKAIGIMDMIALRQQSSAKSEYKTRHFYVYSYKGLSIDVMSAFRIEHDEGIYEFILDNRSIVKRELRDHIEVPFLSLEDWLIAYKLMHGREKKVKFIEDYLASNGIEHPILLERVLEQELPADVRGYIMQMIKP